MAQTYAELLKHPKWQKKRLECLNAAEFTCTYCGSQENSLHVHHGYYERGLSPWEYPDSTLHSLCEQCHSDIEETRLSLYRTLGRFDFGQIEMLLGYALGLSSINSPDEKFEFTSCETICGFAQAWSVDPRALEREVGGGAVIDGHFMLKLRNKGRADG